MRPGESCTIDEHDEACPGCLVALNLKTSHDGDSEPAPKFKYAWQQTVAVAGFEDIDIEQTRVYNVDDARAFLSAAGIDARAIAPKVQDKFIRAFVRARKPARG